MAQAAADFKKIADEWTGYQEAIEGEMMRRLLERKAQNSATPAGTFFKKNGTSLKVTDKIAFLDFVFKLRMNGEPNCYDVLTQAVAKNEILEYRKNHGSLPPGIEAEEYTEIQVRKG